MSDRLENRDCQAVDHLYETGLVVTSECSLPVRWVRPSIRVVPLHIIFGSESYREGVDINTAQFYDRLRKSTVPPTTSGPSPGQYLEALHEVEGRAVLMLTPDRRLSVTYESAVLAARLYAEEG